MCKTMSHNWNGIRRGSWRESSGAVVNWNCGSAIVHWDEHWMITSHHKFGADKLQPFLILISDLCFWIRNVCFLYCFSTFPTLKAFSKTLGIIMTPIFCSFSGNNKESYLKGYIFDNFCVFDCWRESKTCQLLITLLSVTERKRTNLICE